MARIRKEPWFKEMKQKLRDQRAKRKSQEAELAEFEEVTQDASEDKTSGGRTLPSDTSEQDDSEEHDMQKGKGSEETPERSGEES